MPVHVASDGDRYPTDIIYVKTAECEGEVVHPTQKPIELGRYFIRTYSDPGDIILDIIMQILIQSRGKIKKCAFAV